MASISPTFELSDSASDNGERRTHAESRFKPFFIFDNSIAINTSKNQVFVKLNIMIHFEECLSFRFCQSVIVLSPPDEMAGFSSAIRCLNIGVQCSVIVIVGHCKDWMGIFGIFPLTPPKSRCLQNCFLVGSIVHSPSRNNSIKHSINNLFWINFL
jgi:hypothetical protein